MKALVTAIQRFSLTDGDGIRTTVFLKGCQMACPWCHNPETIKKERELLFYRERCIGCGACLTACPTGAHRLEGGVHTIDRALCIACGKCAAVCYPEALTMCGRVMTVDEVMAEVRADAAYYRTSGGGVTVSGGEALLCADFVRALTDACHREGIAVAVETNLCFPFEKIEDTLLAVDSVMADLKLWDDARHRAVTGVSNQRVKENILLLDGRGVRFTVRTPLIPGVTDDEENIGAIAAFLAPLSSLVRYELLNFNPLGEAKYRALDRENPHLTARPLPKERVDALVAVARGAGVACRAV